MLTINQNNDEISRLNLFKDQLIEFIIDNKAIMILVILWIYLAEITGNGIIQLIKNLINMVLLPLNIMLFGSGYSSSLFPEVFFILVPSIIIIGGGFFYLLYSED